MHGAPFDGGLGIPLVEYRRELARADAVPADAFLLALAAAFVHATWNLLTAGADESQVAAGVALLIGALVFLPVGLLAGDVESAALPYAAASIALELGYLACLATAYQRGPLSVVYPGGARHGAGARPGRQRAVPGTTPSAAQVAGVLLVAAGVLLVRGRPRAARPPTSASRCSPRCSSRATRSSTSAGSSTPTRSRTSSSSWPRRR